MADLEKLLGLGQQLGYQGAQLQTFVKEQQEILRKEQKEKDDLEREERRLTREMEEKKADMEREERRLAREAERERTELEKERIALEREKQEKQIAGELEKERIALERARLESGVSRDTSQNNGAPKSIKIPIFNEKQDDLDAYLHRFEIQASNKGWKREDWAGILTNLLTGTALSVLHGMNVEDSRDYDKLKTALLKRFRMTADGYRLRFRTAQPEDTENFDSFVNRLLKFFDRWIQLEGVETGDYKNLYELMLMDQIYAACSKELVTFLKEHRPTGLQSLKELAETHAIAHPAKKIGKPTFDTANSAHRQFDRARPPVRQPYYNEQQPRRRTQSEGPYNRNFEKRQPQYGNRARLDKFQNHDRFSPRYNGGMQAQRRSSQFDDRYYDDRDSWGEHGRRKPHYTHEDIEPQRPHNRYHNDSRKPYTHHANFCHSVHPQQDDRSPIKTAMHAIGGPSGEIRLHTGEVNGKPCTVLRDTGSDCVGVRKDLVREADYTGRTTRCMTFGGHVFSFPTAIVHIDTPFYKGYVEALVLQEAAAGVIIGNIDSVNDDPRDTTPYKGPDHHDDDKSRGFKARHDRATASPANQCHSSSPPQDNPSNHHSDTSGNTLSHPTHMTADFNKELCEAQRADASLRRFFDMAKNPDSPFSVKNNTLVRIVQKDGKTYKQIVVPRKLRAEILRTSHHEAANSHLSLKNTTKRVIQKYTWPYVMRDIKYYVRSCKICKANKLDNQSQVDTHVANFSLPHEKSTKETTPHQTQQSMQRKTCKGNPKDNTCNSRKQCSIDTFVADFSQALSNIPGQKTIFRHKNVEGPSSFKVKQSPLSLHTRETIMSKLRQMLQLSFPQFATSITSLSA